MQLLPNCKPPAKESSGSRPPRGKPPRPQTLPYSLGESLAALGPDRMESRLRRVCPTMHSRAATTWVVLRDKCVSTC
jgi:hypothetical protein